MEYVFCRIDNEPTTIKTLIELGVDIYAKGTHSDKDTAFIDSVRKNCKREDTNSNRLEVLRLLNEADKNSIYHDKRKALLERHQAKSQITENSKTTQEQKVVKR